MGAELPPLTGVQHQLSAAKLARKFAKALDKKVNSATRSMPWWQWDKLLRQREVVTEICSSSVCPQHRHRVQTREVLWALVTVCVRVHTHTHTHTCLCKLCMLRAHDSTRQAAWDEAERLSALSGNPYTDRWGVRHHEKQGIFELVLRKWCRAHGVNYVESERRPPAPAASQGP